MSKVDFIFLHGFLGLPSDWDDVIENIKVDLENSGVDGEYYSVDYFNRPNLSPKNSFDKMATEFVSWAESNTRNSRKILVGYSLGGRLALHIFQKKPELFETLICVSTHPGMKADEEEQIKERETRDQFWSELFLNHNWSEVIQKWNEQSVFEGSDFEPERDSTQYRRDLLSKSLINWSLSKQTDKRMLIRQNSQKILWIAGERDKKFVELTRGLHKENPDLKIELISLAGHRVIFDNSLELARSISTAVLAKEKK
ncbi:MAG: hydrolase [Bdellovibrionaceae bacterium]|nr:hydrolase [Pseudobdellovibrionaceae bacterium]